MELKQIKMLQAVLMMNQFRGFGINNLAKEQSSYQQQI